MDVGFVLTGKMPLLMHADNVDGADRLMAWRKNPANKNMSVPGDDRTPPWTWQTYLYSDGEHVVVPSECLMACLRRAATQITMKGKQTFKAVSQSGMLIVDEYLDFWSGESQIAIADLQELESLKFSEQAQEVKNYGILLYVKRVAVGTSKHIRVRPKFQDWTVSGKIYVSAPEITFDKLEEMFRLAGNFGLGDWRPGAKTPGPFGTFTAELEASGGKKRK